MAPTGTITTLHLFPFRCTQTPLETTACVYTHVQKAKNAAAVGRVSLSLFIVELTKGEVVRRWKMKQIVVCSVIFLGSFFNHRHVKRCVMPICESATYLKKTTEKHDGSNALACSDLIRIHFSIRVCFLGCTFFFLDAPTLCEMNFTEVF